MTGIEAVGWPVSPRGVSRARAKSGFMMPSEPDGAGHATAVPATQATPLASMLALQELSEETVEDREARRHSHDMLAMLAELQRALLGGGDEVAVLHRLADLAAAAPRSDRSAAGCHGIGDRPEGPGGARTPADLTGNRIIMLQPVDSRLTRSWRSYRPPL